MKNILKKLARISENGTDISGLLVILIVTAILLFSLIIAAFINSPPIVAQLLAFGLIIVMLSGMGWLLFITACMLAETSLLNRKPGKVF